MQAAGRAGPSLAGLARSLALWWPAQLTEMRVFLSVHALRGPVNRCHIRRKALDWCGKDDRLLFQLLFLGHRGVRAGTSLKHYLLLLGVFLLTFSEQVGTMKRLGRSSNI